MTGAAQLPGPPDGAPPPETPHRAARDPRHSRIRRATAWTLTTLRWLVVAGWAAIAVVATIYLPDLSAVSGGSDLTAYLPAQSAAVAAEKESLEHFGVPLASRTVLVQRDPEGMSPELQQATLAAAADLIANQPSDLTGILAAVPLINDPSVFPAANEASTTAVTHLFFNPAINDVGQSELAHRYVEHYFGSQGAVVGITGITEARLMQEDLVRTALPWVEIAAIVVVVLAVGLQFRSVLAPLATLLAAGVAYIITIRVLAWAAERVEISAPTELEPLIVVLLLGVVTDYAVFLLSGTRAALRSGATPIEAVRRSVVVNAPWVLAAGLAVTAATVVLLVAQLQIFHALGPGMAVTVGIGLIVSLTLVPALLAILGRAAFWPGLTKRAARRPVAPEPVPAAAPGADPAAAAPGPGSGAPAAPGPEPLPRGFRTTLLRALTVRPVAALVVVLVGGALVFAGWQVTNARLGVSVTDGLPRDSEPYRAEQAASQGFAGGIISPTVVMVTDPGVAGRTAELARLAQALAAQPGVAAVYGPGLEPTADGLGVFRSADGSAVRFALVLDSAPLQSGAIDHVNQLRAALPSLLEQAGLTGTAVVYGDSALAAEIVGVTLTDIWRVTLAALVVSLLVLLLFLRAPIAALYLLVADVLALAAAMGLTTWVSTELLGYSDFTFYVPFAAAVLLLAFGADYTIFLVGRIWDAAGAQPLRDAVIRTGPQAARAITVAGVALGLSFAALAIVPLVPFRQFAIMMVIGIALEIVIVRPVLVPALIALFGRLSVWPRRRDWTVAASAMASAARLARDNSDVRGNV